MKSPALDVFACPLAGMQLIEASAGTGKTWNICGLVLRLLLEKQLRVQDILVVTFTNAATAELRERIRSRIGATLAALRGNAVAAADPFVEGLLRSARQAHGLADEAMARQLDLALQTFDEASIFTIHGFCQRALAEAPFTAGMPMVQTLLEDDRDMVLQAATDFWRRRIAGAALSPELAGCLIARGDSPATLAALLKRRLAKPLSRLRWPPELDEPADNAPVDTTAVSQAQATACGLWRQDRPALVDLVHAALPRLNGRYYKPATVDTAARSWDALCADTSPLPSLRALPKLDLLGRARLQPKKNHAPLPEHPFFDAAQAWLEARARLQQRLDLMRLRLLQELLHTAPQALAQAKRDSRVQAFDDMLFSLHQRLAEADGAALGRTLRARFPAALIDEFQDTDPLQFKIFSTLYAGSGAPLFLVGDPKQAIYSFRNADLPTYLQARRQTQAQYTLAQNQRSTPALLQALNALFGANPQAFMLPGLDYTAVSSGAKERQVLVDDSAPRAALQVWTLPQGNDGQVLSKPDALQASAKACAGEIARLLGAALQGQVTLGGRPLQAGDMAVLVRSHRQGALTRQALAALAVGSVEHSQASVFASPDARELEAVLRGMLEPTREPVLRAALATALQGGDALALHRLADDEAATAQAMQRYSGYHQLWQQRGVAVMLRQWRLTEQVSARLLSRPDGERRLTNLLHLGECLHEAAATHPAPEALCRWLQAQRTQGRTDDAAQLRLASDRNLVQIVTIHKSKGLEYPLVFCPYLWDGHGGGAGSAGDGIEHHDADGHPVLDLRSLDPAEAQAIKSRLALQRMAENLRLVYVALTRAVHRCHLVVGLYGSGAHRSTGEACRGPLSWLVAGAGHDPTAWMKKPVAAPALQAAWDALAAAHAPDVALADLPTEPQPALPPQRTAAGQIAALAPPRHIDAGWAIGSYSSLTQGARHEAAAIDHDQRLQADGDRINAPTAPDDILCFPRGPVAGECLHAVFEHIDFTQPASWPGAIAAALAAHPVAWEDPGTAALGPAMLQAMLADVLHTRLPGGPVLAHVPPARRLVELEFDLPVAKLDATALAHALRQRGYACPLLSFGQLRGHLRGFIDLVFEDAGRFYVLDWKSNHLGHAPSDYAPPALARAMDHHGYHLQYLLYCVALHRHLARRLPGYDFDAQFGGVLYLFVRGVRPHWPGCGSFAHRPDLATLQHLSDLLDGNAA